MSSTTTLDTPTQNTLSEKMAQARDEFIAAQSAQDKATIGAAMEKLMASDFGNNALHIGDRIPQFTLPNSLGNDVSILDYLERGPLVLSFYRGGWCPFCNLEFKALTDCLPEIRQLGASLIGVSPETPEVAQQTVSKHQLPFEVLSDKGNKVTRQFGLLCEIYEEMRPLYLQWGLDVPAANDDDSWELPIPATYVIDQRGIIRAAYVNKDYTQRMEPSDILRALRELAL